MERTVLALALVTALAACSKDKKEAPGDNAQPKTGETGTTTDPKPQPQPDPKPQAEPDPFSAGYCEVNVSGAETHAFKGRGGNMAIGTDYWTSLDIARQQLERTSGGDQAKIEEGLKKDPRMFTLLINCIDGPLNLNFMPANDSKYADVPFGPKKYKILPMMDAKPGDMTLMFGLDSTSFYQLDGEGTLDVTKFDTSSIAGTFAFAVKTDDKKLDVTGKFDLKCKGAGWDLCGK